jgi:hypothetical protein
VVSNHHGAAACEGAQLDRHHQAQREHGMNETCDRCGPAVRAVYRVDRDGELYLCRHCTSQLSAALSAQGRAIWPSSGHALVPQAS